MVIFDFDGVLVNSIDEVTVTAYNTVTDRLVTRLDQLPDPLPYRFQRNRFHVQPIGDAIPLMRWLLTVDPPEPEEILPRKTYLDILAREREPLLERANRFFAKRRAFVRQDPSQWLALNAPFQPVWNALKKQTAENIVILTNKNRAAAFHLCIHFGLKVTEDHIFSGDDGITKIENLDRIHDRFRDPPYTVVEDSLGNLKDLDAHFNRTGPRFVHPILACWGYIGPEDAKNSLALGFSVFTQPDLIDLLNGKLHP